MARRRVRADTEMAKAAPSTCGLCGFYLPCAGALHWRSACAATSMAADGRMVHAEYGLRRPLGHRPAHAAAGTRMSTPTTTARGDRCACPSEAPRGARASAREGPTSDAARPASTTDGADPFGADALRESIAAGVGLLADQAPRGRGHRGRPGAAGTATALLTELAQNAADAAARAGCRVASVRLVDARVAALHVANTGAPLRSRRGTGPSGATGLRQGRRCGRGRPVRCRIHRRPAVSDEVEVRSHVRLHPLLRRADRDELRAAAWTHHHPGVRRCGCHGPPTRPPPG